MVRPFHSVRGIKSIISILISNKLSYYGYRMNSLNATGRPYQRQKFLAGLLTSPERPKHCGRDGGGPGFLHATHGHAQVTESSKVR